jgi:hypothetical protein
MARGKYLSLEEARKKKGGLARFAKEHPNKGDESLFDRLLRLMVGGGEKPEAEDQTSSAAASEDCTETQTPKGTSEDA